MHINVDKKASFYHVMKTGGHALHAGFGDVSSLLGRKPEEHERWKIYIGMHGSYTELKNREPEMFETIKDYYKFAFIRNPFSRAVSMYFHVLKPIRWERELHRKLDGSKAELDDYKDFNNFLENIYVTQNHNTFDDPLFCVDEWFKFEEINEAWSFLCDKFGYNQTTLPVINKTTNENVLGLEYPSDYKIMYDQKGIDIIEKRCGNILEKFGYNF